MKLAIALIAAAALAGCAGGQSATKIETIEVIKEVQKPCPGERAARPTPLISPLPTDLETLAAVLAAKLVEYAGPGKYADKADAIMLRCLDSP